MSRRLLLSFMAIMFAAVTPLSADGPRHCSLFSVDVRCTPAKGSFWRVDFGAPRIAPARRSGPVIQWRGRWQAAPPLLSHRGDLHVQSARTLPGMAAPIDCAMVKHGDSTLDPKIVRQPPARITHSGAIVWVTPCPKK